MVKGRRARQGNAATNFLHAAAAFVDDTASPKRKDFKYDNGDTLQNMVDKDIANACLETGAPMVLRGSRTKAVSIVKYLTHNKPAVSQGTAPADNVIDLTDDNTIDSSECIPKDYEIPPTAGPSLSTLDFCVVKSNPSNNIFLQEPVLSLNVDKTVADNSRMVIKPSFLNTDLQQKFSPPKCDSIWGCTKETRLTNLETVEGALDLSKPTQVTDIDSTTFLNNDSNSSDSGVVITPIENSCPASEGKRRKPATPHRILCPSPIKNPIVASPSTALAQLNIQSKRPGRKNAKPKRRLHAKELENSLEDTKGESDDVKPLAVVGTLPKDLSDKKKPVLNDSINPTAQQNSIANNNSKFDNPPVVVVRSGETGSNKKLTDFFQVRRSVRKTKKEVLWERERDVEKAIREERETGLKICHFEGKGRGVVTTRPFLKGEFVVEYIGELISVAEARSREQSYAEDDNTGCYMYYFKHQNVQHCIDATAESGKLGRLVNHSRNGNLVTKTVSLNKKPHLVLLAKEDIPEGTEVTYDYGDRSKEALQHHPWLAY